jgi:plasmid stabilization system protein ParE
VGHDGVPGSTQTMMLEWSDEALADLDRFAEFLHRDHPALAATVATAIIDKVKVLSEYPQLGRPIAGREEYRQIVLRVLGAAYVFASMADVS